MLCLQHLPLPDDEPEYEYLPEHPLKTLPEAVTSLPALEDLKLAGNRFEGDWGAEHLTGGIHGCSRHKASLAGMGEACKVFICPEDIELALCCSRGFKASLLL